MTIHDWPNLPPLIASVALLGLSRLIWNQTTRRLRRDEMTLFRVRFCLVGFSLAVGLFGLVWWAASTRVP